MDKMEVVQSCLSESDRLLFTPDLINFWLAGEKGNEITMASTSQCLIKRLGPGTANFSINWAFLPKCWLNFGNLGTM